MNRFISQLKLPISRLLSAAILCCAAVFLRAQPNLPSFLYNETPGANDYVIPDNIVFINVELAGAKGGSTLTDCKFEGGKGHGWSFILGVGYCDPKSLRPGGLLRLVTGERGQSVPAPNIGGAGGGGGTALLYQPPGTLDWTVLAVAGGGGGAAFFLFNLGSCQGSEGADAVSTNIGTDGLYTFIPPFPPGVAGTYGNGGSSPSTLYSFGGGGAAGDGITLGDQVCSGKKGYPNGGARGSCGVLFRYFGGFGFGSGGAGYLTGGGGGGFSGGGGGGGRNDLPRGGGGAGSFTSGFVSGLSEFKHTGGGYIRLSCLNGYLTPPISLTSSTLPPRNVSGCSVDQSVGLGLSTNGQETSITLADFSSLGGVINSGGCGLESIIYTDTLDNVNPTTSVIRTYKVKDAGNNIASCKQKIDVVSPGVTATITPISQTACINIVPATISLAIATQTAVTVQWYVGEDAILSNATPIAGATSGSYTPPSTNGVGDYYYLARISTCGSNSTKNSKLTVVSQPITWYKDADNDGYNDPTYAGAPSCTKPGSNFKTFTSGNDCDDNDATYNPTTVWVMDEDGDAYYTGTPFTGCLPAGSTGYVKKTTQLPGDCNDKNNQVNPGMPELVNGIDDNCDGLVDIFCCPPTNILYVKSDAAGENNGFNWANAYKNLGDAIETAQRCKNVTQIWVAGGVYYPDQGVLLANNDQTLSFRSRKGLSIFGGFAGTETSLLQRDLNLKNTSILSGEIQQDGVATNNAYHVFVAEKLDNTSWLDGFTIESGASNILNPESSSKGAGILVSAGSASFKNIILSNNIGFFGAAITCVNTNGIFINCVVTNNNSMGANGLVWIDNSSPIFFQCSFANNKITGSEFVIIKNSGSASPIFVNCIVRGTSLSIVGGTPAVYNSIVQNPTVWPGVGNSNADPLFVNELNGDLRLSPCSPAINAGSSSTNTFQDILGLPRPSLGAFDMGAYELQPGLAVGSRLFVKINATGTGDGSSWTNAFPKLADAIKKAKECIGISEIWVSKGNYFPDEGAGLVDNDRNSSFSFRNNLTVYGGFVGTETLLSQRVFNWENPSYISGNLQQDAIENNNTYNVVTLNNLDSTFVFDGFVVRDGYAENNDGTSKSQGAGFLINGGNPVISNCYIVKNTATLGAAIASLASKATITNCFIAFNHALASAILLNLDGSTTILHCTIAGNTFAGPSLYIISNTSEAKPVIINSIVRGTNTAISGGFPTVSYSLIQRIETYPGTGNINSEPLFADEANGDFRLTPCSPAVNSASSNAATLPGDILGVVRPAFGSPDMGAYELQQGVLTATAGVLFVNAAATGNGSGNSWNNAVTNLQYALKNSCSNAAEIWVAKGTYCPTTNSSRDSAFVMRNNLAIYGGFAGTETLLSQRNWNFNKTILSGDIGVLNTAGDNSYNVVRNDNNGLNNTAILDGFTITAGNASSLAYVGSVGGAIFNRGGSAVYRNCTLTGNQARVYAGGFFSETGSPLLINSVIAGNVASFGAGAYNESATTNIINCTFAGNLAAGNGGGFYTYGLPVANLRNCVMWGNSSGIGVTAVNSNPPVVSNSLVQGGFAGTENISVDVLYMLTPTPGLGSTGNLRLRPCSPAINAGSNTALPAGGNTDLAGLPRIAYTSVDMGAYERQSAPVATVYADSAAKGNNDGSSWLNAYNSLTDAVNDLNTCSDFSAPTTINIAKGSYTLPVNENTILNRLNAIVLGGYPTGGGTRNPALNPVLIIGNVQVAKSLQLDGIRIRK